jgi:orotidine-5'-phosphate decarboxylase
MIVQRDRSVIPACDVPHIDDYRGILEATGDLDGIGGYKVGCVLGLTYGLIDISNVTGEHTDKPIIYDHQKAGTDIPSMGAKFADTMWRSGISAAILFPQAGPETQEAFIKGLQDQGVGVIVGGLMTHPRYLRGEGGYIDDAAALEMYVNAARMGVTDFVVPGNRPDDIRRIKQVIEGEGVAPVFWAPGFVAQGGTITEGGEAAGDRFHAIVGRGIYQAADKRQAAIELTSQL